jgi:hypothetical protein
LYHFLTNTMHSAPRHASRALLLPEIVATILRTGSTSPGFLHICLFINKIFSFEALSDSMGSVGYNRCLLRYRGFWARLEPRIGFLFVYVRDGDSLQGSTGDWNRSLE